MKTISYKIHRYVYVRSPLNRTNYHMPTDNDSLTISVQQEAKSRFHVAAILLISILQKRSLYESCILLDRQNRPNVS
jgi:hypothetical protein